ncbi:uncharacterized protein [Spinacia oleracea]|uniref:Reverse transcriptase zinc-binding domain-containing protein n=1 Tax=Spinacia oleracea TaxID=3562 RepID=A0ABM3RT09_SPIOL|nr:uncharacterized protein LOC110783659 [Spinacia oleracea]
MGYNKPEPSCSDTMKTLQSCTLHGINEILIRISKLLLTAYKNKLLTWNIGDGRKVRVSSDKWVHGRVPVLASNIRLMDAKVWKDANEILSVELPSCPTSDFVYWTKHKTGNFTLKSGYAFLREIDMQQHPLNHLDRKRFLPFFKLLWALKILPKWKLFLWKLILNGIPLKTNLERRGIILDTKCDFCEEYCEDAQHIFRLCKLAQDVWRSSMLGILSNINESLSMQDWILNYIQLFISVDGKFSDRVVTFIATLWAIWITRNERVFRSNAGDITVFQIQFKLALEQHNVFRGKDDGNLGFLHPPEHKQDYPPRFYFANIGMEITLPTSTTVILIDGAWNKDTFRAGMGWVLKQRQSDDMEIIGGCDYGLVYTDSTNLVSYLRKQVKPNIQLLWTIDTIFEVGKRFKKCIIYKVHRDQIHSAHVLAKRASTDGMQFSSGVGNKAVG